MSKKLAFFAPLKLADLELYFMNRILKDLESAGLIKREVISQNPLLTKDIILILATSPKWIDSWRAGVAKKRKFVSFFIF